MAFIVQAYQTDTDRSASTTFEQREDALETALHLIERGRIGVKIIGDGRIYNPAEFALTIPKVGRCSSKQIGPSERPRFYEDGAV